MRVQAFTVVDCVDTVATVQEGLAEFGSLRASRENWARLVRALGGETLPYLDGDTPSIEDAAEEIVVSAVPEEGDPHPARASWRVSGPACVDFHTPGGVLVSVFVTDDGAHPVVYIDYGRDSHHAATMVAAAFARRLPSAVPVLAQAAAEYAGALV